jgi:hypothetical protein
MAIPFGERERLQSPECTAALVVLHRWLDGEAAGIPPDVAAHTAMCSECGGRFAAMGQLSAGLSRSVSYPPPVRLTEQIVGAVLADYRHRRRSRRRLWLAGAAVAAAIVAALWLVRPPGPSAPGPTAAQEMARGDGTAPDLRRDLLGAGEAVAALTRRAADEVAGAGKQLLPPMPPPVVPPEPDRPLADAGAALADGLEPVGTSARRAAHLLWREFSMEDDKK